MAENGTTGSFENSPLAAGAGPEQRAVLASLSPSEAAVLTGVWERLVAAESEVTAHINKDGGVFW